MRKIETRMETNTMLRSVPSFYRYSAVTRSKTKKNNSFGNRALHPKDVVLKGNAEIGRIYSQKALDE